MTFSKPYIAGWIRPPPASERPIVGEAVEKDFIQRLTRFLLAPLLAVEREFGSLNAIVPLMPFAPQSEPTPQEREDWVRTMRALGQMW